MKIGLALACGLRVARCSKVFASSLYSSVYFCATGYELVAMRIVEKAPKVERYSVGRRTVGGN